MNHSPFRRKTWLNQHMPIRIQCAWNCLRGRPTCYRMTIKDGGIELAPNMMLVQTALINNRSNGPTYGPIDPINPFLNRRNQP